MDFIPEFNFQAHVIAPWISPWTEDSNFWSTIWVFLMGFLVAAACGLVGNYLILRRMALVGDAISHSVLPGIAIAFLIAKSRSSSVMFLGALAAGIVTTILIEIIHKKTRVKQDSAIGIAFTSLFALGVILISLYASKIDLDQECVLYGEIAFVPLDEVVKIGGMSFGPLPVFRMAIVAALTLGLIVVFYKELLVSSFDAGLAAALGINATLVHYSLMAWLSVVVVSAFESVGAILVIAMLILPGATAQMLSTRFPAILAWTVVCAALSSALGIHLATWLDCSMAGAMVVMASALFCAAWLISPHDGLIRRWSRAKLEEPGLPEGFPADSESSAGANK